MAFDIFGGQRDDTGSDPRYQAISRLDKVAILVGLLDATIDHERNRDTPFQATEWLVKHYPHVHPNDLDHVLDAGRHALTRLVG